jgi:hypothetical protein
MKQLLVLTAMVITSTAYGQLKTNAEVPYTISQQMLLKSASEQKLYVKARYRAMTFGVSGLAFMSLSQVRPDDVQFFYIIGGALSLVGIYSTITAPIHLKRSAAYVEASVSGIKISF